MLQGKNCTQNTCTYVHKLTKKDPCTMLPDENCTQDTVHMYTRHLYICTEDTCTYVHKTHVNMYTRHMYICTQDTCTNVHNLT